MSVDPSAPLAKFLASLDPDGHQIGQGYDLVALGEASAAERASVEAGLLGRSDLTWRDVQALAVMESDKSRARLRREAKEGAPAAKLEAAVQLHARGKFEGLEEVLEESLAQGLHDEALLASTLRAIERFRPAGIVHPLLRVVLDGRGEAASLCAAMACYVRGKAAAGFDWSMRPFFLRFNTKDRAARRLAFAELCGRLGEDPVPFLSVSSAAGLPSGGRRGA